MADVMSLADGVADVLLMVRDTAQHGRMRPDEWERLVPPAPRTRVVVCGPLAFHDDVCAARARAGWPADQVTTESFLGGPGAPPLRRTQTFDYRADPVVAKSFHLRRARYTAREVTAFLKQFYFEHGARDAFAVRMRAVHAQLRDTGGYQHTYDELAFGGTSRARRARCMDTGRGLCHR